MAILSPERKQTITEALGRVFHHSRKAINGTQDAYDQYLGKPISGKYDELVTQPLSGKYDLYLGPHVEKYVTPYANTATEHTTRIGAQVRRKLTGKAKKKREDGVELEEEELVDENAIIPVVSRYVQQGVDASTTLGGRAVEVGTNLSGRAVEVGTNLSGRAVEVGTNFGTQAREVGTNLGGRAVEVGTQLSGRAYEVVAPVPKKVGDALGVDVDEHITRMRAAIGTWSLPVFSTPVATTEQPAVPEPLK